MKTVLGIDLGTSNTVVAHADENGVARVLADEEGQVLIPSVIAMLPGRKVLVGRPARERRFSDPRNTVLGAKRLIGRAYNDPDLDSLAKRLTYELRRGKNEEVRVLLRGELYTIPELSAFVLRKAKAVAEAALGEPVERAVITVPANFNDLQREATKLAGELAELDVVRVLNEPTAAALAFAYASRRNEQIVVYDLGGGTFDVTLLSLSESVFRVRATAGDMFLGGEDIDNLIADTMAAAFLKRHYYDVRSHAEVFDQVRHAAEEIKLALTDAESTETRLGQRIQEAGGPATPFVFTMTRAELDALLDPLIERTLEVTKQALARVRAGPGEVNRVVLVGGSTRIPRVRERVAAFFGREPESGVNPDEVVALGAAIHAASLRDVPKKERAERPVSIAPTASIAPPVLRPISRPPLRPKQEPQRIWWPWLVMVAMVGGVVAFGFYMLR